MTEDTNKNENKNEANANITNKNEAKKEKKYVKSVWRSVSVAFIILFIVTSAVLASSSLSGTVPFSFQSTEAKAPDEVAQTAVDFIKENMVAPGTEVSVKEVSEEKGLYKIVLEVKSGTMAQEVESYITKDGKIFFPQAIDMDEVEAMKEESEEQESQEQETQDVPKTDKPKVHAFVMSYCPYGLQFMKAYVPVMELLGEKADLELNFVNYAMHEKKELDENTRMYCIQKEQNDKLTDYLRCFLEKDDYESCIESTGVDSDMLEACIASTDEEFNITELYNDKSTWSGGRFPKFPVEDDLNEEYGVRGSPTFVINDKVISVNRSPEAIKDVICSAFNNPPEECEEELSDKAEQPGIGSIGAGSGASSGGQC